MSKVHSLSKISLIVEVIASISLIIEVFGKMNPGVLTISAIVLVVGKVGSCICAMAKTIRE